MPGSLEGRRAAVTGASSGIGEAAALALAAEGASVALGARRKERLEDLAGRIEADILHAVSAPKRVNVNEILVRPTGQMR
jgi:NADP-dependent 3-hydroxy acid dehydrogenase YdfG